MMDVVQEPIISCCASRSAVFARKGWSVVESWISKPTSDFSYFNFKFWGKYNHHSVICGSLVIACGNSIGVWFRSSSLALIIRNQLAQRKITTCNLWSSFLSKDKDMADKKVVLITGCSSGIGKALAFEFQKHNCRVFASARSVDKLGDLPAAGIDLVQLDITDADSMEVCIPQSLPLLPLLV